MFYPTGFTGLRGSFAYQQHPNQGLYFTSRAAGLRFITFIWKVMKQNNNPNNPVNPV